MERYTLITTLCVLLIVSACNGAPVDKQLYNVDKTYLQKEENQANHQDILHHLMFSNKEMDTVKTKNNIREPIKNGMDRKTLQMLNNENVTWSYNKSVNVNWSCDICKVIVGLVQTGFAQNKSESEIAVAAIDVCVKLKLYHKRVCEGAVHLFKVQVLTVTDKLLLSPSEICGFTFGNHCGKSYDPDTMWNVTLPDVPKPPLKPVQLPKSGMLTLRVLQLSDIHIDRQYIEGGNVQCGEPICCRIDDGKPVGTPAPNWGTYQSCDLPNITLYSTFQHLAQQHKLNKFDYVIFTGDIPAHYVWLSSQKDTRQLMYELTQLFRDAFPGVPVYFSLGNHEGVPVNSFPPDWPVVPWHERDDWLYETCVDTWKHWLPNDTVETIRRGGFYTTLVKPGLRMVSLNMNFCNNKNWWLLLNMTDPVGELAWLIQVLQDSENKNEKVHIIGHIPPSSGDCVQTWRTNFYKIINRYEQTVVAQFFGHYHTDTFKVYYDAAPNSTRPIAVTYISPSVVASGSGNSAYRVYTVDGPRKNSTWMVLDHSTMLFNLTQANAGSAPNWTLEYSAKEAYNMSSLLPSEWDKLIYRMEKEDKYFKKYLKYNSKMSHQDSNCTGQCKRGALCGFMYAPNNPQICSRLNVTNTQFELWQSQQPTLC